MDYQKLLPTLPHRQHYSNALIQYINHHINLACFRQSAIHHLLFTDMSLRSAMSMCSLHPLPLQSCAQLLSSVFSHCFPPPKSPISILLSSRPQNLKYRRKKATMRMHLSTNIRSTPVLVGGKDLVHLPVFGIMIIFQ